MNHTLPAIDNTIQAPKLGSASKWLEEHASDKRVFLLAFADDGIIWGKYENGLKTAAKVVDETLQQAHLFGEEEELRLFHGQDGNWKACLINDAGVNKDDRIDEIQLLWGNEVVQNKNTPTFTVVRDRVQKAMEHTLPLPALQGLDLDDEGPRLLVRHFIDYDKDTGEARIFLSRLVKLGIGPIAEEKIK